MSDKNKVSAFFKTAGREIKTSILTKYIGFYVAVAAIVLSFIQTIIYGQVNGQDLNVNAIIFSVLGIVFFLLLSLFRKTSTFAPLVLMAFDFFALLAFVSKIIDYFSTAFFGGFSAAKFFAMPAPYWLSTVCFILSAIVSAVAVYLPQNRELKVKEELNVEARNDEIEEV